MHKWLFSTKTTTNIILKSRIFRYSGFYYQLKILNAISGDIYIIKDLRFYITVINNMSVEEYNNKNTNEYIKT